MKQRTLFIIATVLATLFIFSNSLQSAELSSEASGVLVAAVSKVLSVFGYSPDADTVTYFVRKAAHLSEFTLHGLLLTGCFSMAFKRRIIYVLFFGLATGCIDEYLQLFSDGRASMVQDVFIDFAGTILGLWFFGITRKFRGK